MPERGGPTTQSGVFYQNSVTAVYLGRLCDGASRPGARRVTHVRVETPDDVDDTVVAFDDGSVVYIQAKERLARADYSWVELWRAFATQFHREPFVRGRDRLCLCVGEAVREHSELRELCDRARAYDDASAWERALSAQHRHLVSAIGPLLAPTLPVGRDLLHAFFSHVDVDLWPLRQIEGEWVPYWMPLANRDPHHIFRLLRDRVGGAARVRGTFTAAVLRPELQRCEGIEFRAAPDMDALRAAVRDCGALLRQHKATLGETEVHIQRAVVRDMQDWALDQTVTRRVGLLLDDAGRGKTVVMRDVMTELEARGVTVLAIKADQQLAGLDDAAGLHERLRLPEPVERVASRLVADGPVVVIVDQLDALALSLARNQNGLNAVLDLIARIRAVPGTTTLISCRRFDRNTDPRLKRLEVGREFPLPLLDDAELDPVLTVLEIEPGALAPATRELLRTPLHLDVFARLAAAPDSASTRLRGMQSLQELYTALWQEVVVAPTASGVSAGARVRLLRAMTERMHRDQRLSVPQSYVVGLPDAEAGAAADTLASSGLLIQVRAEWGLLHQSFFDYCYARFFVEDGHDLAVAVLASDQGLFARPQVVHVLAYLRGYDHSSYVRTLTELVAARDLRFHLRDLVLRWVAAQPDPLDSEWRLMYSRLLDPATRLHAIQVMMGHPVWLTRLTGGALDGLLAGEAAFVDEGLVPYLASIVDSDVQASVAELVRPWFSRDGPWPARAQSVGQRIRAWRTPNAVALFEELVHRLPLERVRHLFELDDVAAADPAAGCRLVRGLLDRILAAYADEPAGNTRVLRGLADGLEVLNGSAGQQALGTVSTAAPEAFLETMVPWLERAVTTDDGCALRATDRFYAPDPITPYVTDEGLVIRHALIQAYVSALASLANTDGVAFVRAVERLASLAYTTPHLILNHVFRQLASDHATSALTYVLGDVRRLRLGWNDAYHSRMLLRALAPHLGANDFARLEAFILQETGHLYRSADGRASLRWRGVDQLHLLRALARERLSGAALACLRELERKFPDVYATDSPTTVGGGFVGPPIPVEACARMSDTSWLGAMHKYAGNVRHEDILRGGAMQLARVFAEQVKVDPARFGSLADRLPDDVDDDYVNALFDGLAESACPPEWLFAVIRRFASPGRKGVHRHAAWAVEKVLERGAQLPDDLLDRLDQWVRGEPRTDEPFYEERDDLSAGALNTDRGAALRVLMRALARDSSDTAVAQRWALIDTVVRDPSPVVAAAGLAALLPLLDADRSRATDLFEALVRSHPRLVTTTAYARFLYYASYGQFRRLGPYIRDLMQARSPRDRQRGAELAVLGALSSAGLEDDAARALANELAESAITGALEWRQGAARIFAHNWADYPGPECQAGLVRLFNDSAVEVRREAAWMTHRLRPEHVVVRQTFLSEFAASHAARSGAHDFAEHLWQHGLLDPAWALSVVATLLENPYADEEGPWFGGGESLVRLVLRVYTEQSAGTALRERATTLFDQLMQRFAGYAMAAISEWDRS